MSNESSKSYTNASKMLKWNVIFKKSFGHLQQSIEMRFKFVKSNRSTFPMKKMFQILKISMSGFYAWCNRLVSQRQRQNSLLRKRVTTIYNEHNGMIGSPMLSSELRDEPLFQSVSQARVARHMRALGLRCKYATKFVPTTDSAHTEPVAPNLLDRNLLHQLPIRLGAQILRTPRLDESGII